jgi:quinol monooxygenase YgiN
MESPTLVDVWTVDPARREELLERVREILRDVVAKQPGFVSAQVYESTDEGAVMVSIAMRTIKERQDLTDSAEIQTALRELRAIAHSQMRLYRLVESLGAGD